MLYGTSKVVLFLLFKFLLRIRGVGTEHIPRQGGVLLACNHVSFLDPPCLGVVCPRRVYFVAREDLFEEPFLGFLIKRYQTIPVARGEADLSAIRAVTRRLRQKRVVCLFPEGTRSPDGRVKVGQLGIGFLSVKTVSPVVPVYIHGTHKALPRGQHWIRPYPVRILFGKPIDPREISEDLPAKERYRRVTQAVMDSLRDLESSGAKL